MKRTNLSQEELNNRCAEVFDLQVGDYIYDLTVTDDDTVRVEMSEEPDVDIIFDYEPDMTERPTALAYLLGERNNFED